MDIKTTLHTFFSGFLDSKGKTAGHYLRYLDSALEDFVETGTKKQAYEVYRLFLDIYNVEFNKSGRFLDLLDALRKYEENVATANDRQRDHYVHSVNVFLLGLCIYANNQNYRNFFTAQIKERCYPLHFPSVDEEFLFCWGIASLFHDIGYPVEIISNQIKKYIGFVVDVDEHELDAKPYIDFFDFSALNSIRAIRPNCLQMPDAMANDPALGAVDTLTPTDLLALGIHKSYGIPFEALHETINGFLETMQKTGFVDHGFFSAIIVLKWYGELLQKSNQPSGLFYSEIALASEAIFLHNFYSNVLLSPRFALGPMHPKDNALAFLLILCDESQEWNRESYGEKDKTNLLFIDTSEIAINESNFSLKYITDKGIFPDDFADKRHEALDKRLQLEPLFASGVSLATETRSGYYLETSLNHLIMPRLIIDQLEKLAQMIHEDYVRTQLERNPGENIEYPTWDSLPPSLKYSNIRQAAAIPDKVSRINCYLDDDESRGEEVLAITAEEVELLAIYEHDLWVEERLESGWTFGATKNTKKKQTPYLVPYADLTEEIKELDRDTIRNIIPLANAVGLQVYRPKSITQ
jgi:hypothetical protein